MITVLVEGRGDKRALPILVHRELGKRRVRSIDMQGKSNIVRQDRGVEAIIRRQRSLGERTFVVLMDADVTFPPYHSIQEEQSDMALRAKALEQELGAPARVCWSILEMESWLIGGIQPKATYCGLRRVGKVPANTELDPQDPKAWLETRLQGSNYSPATQECLARNIDIEEAKIRNESMQALLEVIA